MMVTHHTIHWLETLLEHARFLGALVNPFTLVRTFAWGRIPVRTVVLEREASRSDERDSSDGMGQLAAQRSTGALIINADDWGRDRKNTDRILDCVRHGTVSSTSAMVFMEDSERSASLAHQHNVDAGLHLNLSSPFTAPNCPPRLLDEQQLIAQHLRRHRLSRIVPSSRLSNSFEYVVLAQLEEYQRLFGKPVERLDGHHHMHLCANVRLARLIPEDVIVRPNFSFLPGEKSFFNRRYRQVEDRMLAERHRCVDYFFSIAPLEPKERLERIVALAQDHAIEVETHPVNQDEYEFLMGDGVRRWVGDTAIAPRFVLPEVYTEDSK